MKAVPAHVPAVGKARIPRVPAAAEQTLRNGLRVIAVRRPSVPRVEVRLRVAAGHAHDRGDGARARLLPEALLGGTTQRSSVDIARELQRLGATLQAGADADHLSVQGGCLSQSLAAYLALVAEVVAGPSFPADEVAVARDRLAQEIEIQLSQPQIVVRLAELRRIFGKHRYGRGLPRPDAVRRVGPAPVRAYHRERLLPRGGTLILVGDLQPQRALERAADAFGGWKGPRPAAPPGPPGPIPSGLPLLVVDRLGSVQTNVRLAGPAVRRGHPEFYALALATMALGGYFSSRLFKNVREEKGYAYGIQSFLDHRAGASTFHVATACATEVTAPALHEIRYELGRMCALPVAQGELDAARRFLLGVTMLQTQTQAGFASWLDTVTAAGLGLDYLRSLPQNLERVTTEDVVEVSNRYLAPRRLLTVMAGDAGTVARALESLDEVEVRT